MPNNRIDVVILAAGNGLRLSSLSPLPKPLVSIDARPLLDRVLAALVETGLHRVTIVVGHAADSIRHHPFPSAAGLEIAWVENPRYSQPNGLSLLCAEGHVRAPFVLLMADHLFEPNTLRLLLREPCPADGAVLAVDRNVQGVYDLEDATKVVTRGSALQEIGKNLDAYDAIDTGMFLCSDAIFAAMRTSASNGGQSLSNGVAMLARTGRMRTWDIGGAAWIDVDTPGARDEAERMVRAGCFAATPRPEAPRPLHAEQRRHDAPSAPRRIDRVSRPGPLVPCEDADLVGEPG
jgi:choline kinase